jgi:hypothetical protein
MAVIAVREGGQRVHVAATRRPPDTKARQQAKGDDRSDLPPGFWYQNAALTRCP